MFKKKPTRIILTMFLLGAIVVMGCNSSLSTQSKHADVKTTGIQKDNSGRYFQKNGQPFFFIGYYNWVPKIKGERYGNHATLKELIDIVDQYDLNYLRISLVLSGGPFKKVNGKVDLDQWDPDFWSTETGLPWHVQYAESKGVNMHISIFDGWSIKKPTSWSHSFWNIANQSKDFYGDLNADGDRGADEVGGFYRTADFVNDTGVGFYQKKLIDKVVAELAPYENVFYEVGNELMGSSMFWNYEVINYIKSLTDKIVTINLNPPQWVDNNPGNDQGYSIHVVEPKGTWEGGIDNSLEVKKMVEARTGDHVPVFYDPDGPNIGKGFADENRRSAWYSLTGGAAGYGGFQSDIRNCGPDTMKLQYYQYLMNFLSMTDVPFWTMTPQVNLISNNLENNLLVKKGEQYLAYLLNDDSATINLQAGSYKFKTFNPKTGTYSAEQTIAGWGGGNKTFSQPSGEDWVIYIYKK